MRFVDILSRLARSGPYLLTIAVVLLDVLVAWALNGLGMDGLRAIGGWGVLMVGMVLVAAGAANLLLLLVFVYRRTARQAATIREQSP
jgi:hypothetical protein